MIASYLCKTCATYCNVTMVEHLCAEAKKKSTSLPNEVLHHSTFEKVVTILVESKAACTSNEQYVATVLENLLNDSESKTVSTTEVPR